MKFRYICVAALIVGLFLVIAVDQGGPPNRPKSTPPPTTTDLPMTSRQLINWPKRHADFSPRCGLIIGTTKPLMRAVGKFCEYAISEEVAKGDGIMWAGARSHNGAWSLVETQAPDTHAMLWIQINRTFALGMHQDPISIRKLVDSWTELWKEVGGFKVSTVRVEYGKVLVAHGEAKAGQTNQIKVYDWN